MCQETFDFSLWRMETEYLNTLRLLSTGVMAASEIPSQMANFQTFFLKDLFFLSGLF